MLLGSICVLTWVGRVHRCGHGINKRLQQRTQPSAPQVNNSSAPTSGLYTCSQPARLVAVVAVWVVVMIPLQRGYTCV